MDLEDKKKSIGFTFAFAGLREALKTERNLRIHLIACLCTIILGFFLKLSNMEWIVLLLTVCIVITLELVNSVIEKIIDYVKPEIHPEAKVIKDIGAGTVLVAAIIAAIIGVLLFGPKLIAIFF